MICMIRCSRVADLLIPAHYCRSLSIAVDQRTSLCITVHHCASLGITGHHCRSLFITVDHGPLSAVRCSPLIYHLWAELMIRTIHRPIIRPGSGSVRVTSTIWSTPGGKGWIGIQTRPCRRSRLGKWQWNRSSSERSVITSSGPNRTVPAPF